MALHYICYFAKLRNMSDIYQALSHPTRRQIIALLRQRAHSAGEIAEACQVAKPTLSGHLNVLKNAGLISHERQQQTLIYRVNISVLEDAITQLMDLFKIGEGGALAPFGEKSAEKKP